MNKQYILAFCIFGLLTLVFFFGGILGVVFSIKRYDNIRKLEESNIIESASITQFQRSYRTSSNLIYFTTQNDGKIYRFNLIKLASGKIEVGDEIEVKFNEDKTLFLITNYSFAFYIGYIVQIILFVICIILSILFLYGTILIFKYI